MSFIIHYLSSSSSSMMISFYFLPYIIIRDVIAIVTCDPSHVVLKTIVTEPPVNLSGPL